MLTEEKEGLLGCSQSDETRTKWMVQEQEWMKTGDEQCGCCPRSCCCRGMNGLQCLWLRIKISMILGLLFTMISGVWDVLKTSGKQEAFVVPGALFVVFRVLLSLYGMFCACKEKRQLLPQCVDLFALHRAYFFLSPNLYQHLNLRLFPLPPGSCSRH